MGGRGGVSDRRLTYLLGSSPTGRRRWMPYGRYVPDARAGRHCAQGSYLLHLVLR